MLRVHGRFSPGGYTVAGVYNYCISCRGGGGVRSGSTFLTLPRRRTFGCFSVFGGALSKDVKGGVLGVRFPLSTRVPNKARRFLLGLHSDHLRSSVLLRRFCSGIVTACRCTRGCCVVLVRTTCSIPKEASSSLRVSSTSSRMCRRVLVDVYPIDLSGTKLDCGTRRGYVRSEVHS